MEVSHPQAIGSYEIAGVLGQGGMGVVYRAKGADGRDVALKVLRAEREDLARRFTREARIKIEHPNVVKLIEAGTAPGGTAYIAFELLEGESLLDVLRKGGLAPNAAARLGVQVCRGLAAAHQRGIVHRDLKPSNIFLTRDGTAKILDFGIAYAGSLATQLTLAGQVMGTPSYVSPEQARGELALDGRADVFALGAVLYETLTGVRAFFRPDGVLSTLLAVAIDEVTPILTRNPKVPLKLAGVVERAMMKAKDLRWPSADAFGDALSGAMDGGGDVARERPRAIATHEQRLVTIVLAEGVRELERIEASIEQQGGAFVPLIGDRAIGIFGGERSHGDEARRAAAAALEMRAVAAKVAVASGRVMIAGTQISGGTLKKAEDALKIESRGVVLDSETARALSMTLPVLSPGCLELTQLGAELPSSSFSGPWRSLLLGREAELAQASAAVMRVAGDLRGVAVLVEGAAGTGKTRLKEEVARLVREQMRDVIVLDARAEPLKKNTAFSLFAAAIASRADLDSRGQISSRREGELRRGDGARDEASSKTSLAQSASTRFAEDEAASKTSLAQSASTRFAEDEAASKTSLAQSAIMRLAAEAMRDGADDSAPFLGELLGVRMPMNAALGAALEDAQLMADRLRLAVLDYLFGLAETRPVALFIDDLHRADDASQELLSLMLDRLDEGPVLVFMTARPELGDLLLGKELMRIQPSGLRASEVGRLASEILGKPLDEAWVRSTAERTGGNPAFVEQIALAVRDRNQPLDELDQMPLPISVEAALQSRLDHLPAEEKELLKHAAIFGRPFTLRELAELGIGSAEQLCASLAKKDLLRRVRASGSYRFHSSLLAEVAYKMLPDAARTALHQRAAEALSELAASDPEEIARHLEAAGAREEAALAYAGAAHRAAGRGDSEAVLRLASDALRLGVEQTRRFQLFMDRGDAYRFLGRKDDQAVAFAAAAACAVSDVERARALNEEVDWLDRAGRAEEAVAAGERAVELARSSANRDVLIIALGRKVMALVHSGKAEQARAASEEASRLAEDAPVFLRALTFAWRAQIAAALGDSGAARDAFRAAMTFYLEAGDVRRAAGAASNLADAYNRVGAYAEAEAALREALKGCRRVGNRIMEGYSLVNLGYALMMLARTDEALAALEQAATLAKAMKQPRLEVMAQVHRVQTLLDVEPPAAVATEARAIALRAESIRAAALEANALTIAARALLKAGDASGALELSTRALALRDQLGGVEEDEADVFLTHAETLVALGRREESRQVLLRGRKRLMEIAAGISDPEWRARFLRDVPAHRFMLAGAQ